ncbi:hypothetical protein [Jiella marina]|uniref:hypothetical protein n=1 Tax=Jiella sp. LLJ827 TaxID=2917712 RepID=UPI002100BF3C|nr:hypothetical protein [Jiella sp. LLJ827]MCQ0989122.1 hypothetical protein [Jiella sp. LLJ827]
MKNKTASILGISCLAVIATFATVSWMPADAVQEKAIDIVVDGVHAAAKATASTHPRPTSGPCAGERVHSPDECTVNILKAMRESKPEAAADAILRRVAGRENEAVRVMLVFRKTLELARIQEPVLKEDVVSATREMLVSNVEDTSCKAHIGITVVHHWLHLNDRERAIKALQDVHDPAEGRTTCLLGTSGALDVHRYALIQAEIPFDRIGLFMDANLSFVRLVNVPDQRIPMAILEAAMRAGFRDDEKLALNLLAATARDTGNTKIAEHLESCVRWSSFGFGCSFK